MLAKVMLVDDDQSLLNTLHRNLCLEFNVCKAEGGIQAIEKLKSEGPISVAIVDMRMPGLDGIETIQDLREIQPNIEFIMLTGNQDSATAIQAMNVGHVFRFLTKPCEIADVKSAILDAQQLFDSKLTEKELLLDTLLGSINMLTQLAIVHSKGITTPGSVRERFNTVANAFEIPRFDGDRVLCRVILAGLSSLNAFDRERLLSARIDSLEHQELVKRICTSSAQMIEHLPKFAEIATILNRCPDAENLSSFNDPVESKATVLRIALYWSLLHKSIKRIDGVIVLLKELMPNISNREWGILADFHEERLNRTAND